MIDGVYSLINEYLSFKDILLLRVVSKGILLESRESTNLQWGVRVSIPSVFAIFPKLRNISIGLCQESCTEISLGDFLAWFMTSDRVLRLSLMDVHITADSEDLSATRVQHIDPPMVSLSLFRVVVSNTHLCGLVLRMSSLQSFTVNRCPCFDDRAANLLLSYLPNLKQVTFEELFELKCLDYSQSPVRIQELSVKRCPRLVRLRPNHYLRQCTVAQTAVTGSDVDEIMRESTYLQEMTVEACRSVLAVTARSTSLLRLSVARCMLLQHLLVDAPSLTHISLEQCHRLAHIDIDAPALRALVVPHLSDLSSLYVTGAELRRLDLTGCLQLYHSVRAIRTATAPPAHQFAVSRHCMMSGCCSCRKQRPPHRVTDEDVLGAAEPGGGKSSALLPSTASPPPLAAAVRPDLYRRCFHHDRISLCCPKLKTKATTLVFPMQPDEVSGAGAGGHPEGNGEDSRRTRRESV